MWFFFLLYFSSCGLLWINNTTTTKTNSVIHTLQHMHVLDVLDFDFCQVKISPSLKSIIWWMLAWRAWKCISLREGKVVIIACGGARLGAAEDQNSFFYTSLLYMLEQDPALPITHTNTHTRSEVVVFLVASVHHWENKSMSNNLALFDFWGIEFLLSGWKKNIHKHINT